MELVKKLDEEIIKTMKAQEKLKLTVLREIKANMKQANIDAKKEINDELLIDVVTRGIKTRRESIKEFEKGAREDLINKTNEEISVLETYLPKQLTEEEILEIINKAFDEIKPTSMKEMGKVMAYVTPLTKGKADMSYVSKLIKERIG